MDADVDHRRAGAHVVGVDQTAHAGGRDQDVRVTTHPDEVAGAPVAAGHSRVALQQHLRERPAHQLGAAHDDHVGATDVDVIAVEQLDHAERRARVEPGNVAREPAGAQDREAVDVLVRVDQLDQRHRIEVLGERQLQQDRGDLRVGRQLRDQGPELLLRRLGRQVPVQVADPQLDARAAL